MLESLACMTRVAMYQCIVARLKSYFNSYSDKVAFTCECFDGLLFVDCWKVGMGEVGKAFVTV